MTLKALKNKSTDQIKTQKKELAKRLFGGTCFVCKKPYGKYFAFHHKRYIPNEPVYSDFSSSEAYNKVLFPIIEGDPERFSLLCQACHTVVTKLCRYGKDKFRRLIDVTEESRND